MKIIPASDSSLLVVFGDAISPDMQQRVLALFHALQARRDPRIRNLHPAYASLLIDFDPLLMTHEEVAALVESLSSNAYSAVSRQRRSGQHSCVLRRGVWPRSERRSDAQPHQHRRSGAASFVGDVLCLLPRLHGGFRLPRRAAGGAAHSAAGHAAARVAAGSVGIAGSQTGIYPTETPGGWRLIGRTPLRMFDPQAQPPTRLQPGDRVRFAAIDREAFERLRQERA